MSVASATWHTRVRVYECDGLGHVNNAWYLAYLQQATAEAWGREAPALWQLRRLAIEYLAPALAGDALEVRAWPGGMENDWPICGYEIRRADDGKAVARALAVWTWLDPATHEAWPRALAWPESPDGECVIPRPLRLPPDRLGGHAYCWQHRVRHYEMNPQGQAGSVELLRWLEEAKYVACAEAGWPPERLLAANCIIVQSRHDSEIHAGLRRGDVVEIASRVYDVGRVRGTWREEVYRLGELVAVEYSTGAFLDRAGRPSPPPQELVEALVRGPGGKIP